MNDGEIKFLDMKNNNYYDLDINSFCFNNIFIFSKQACPQNNIYRFWRFIIKHSYIFGMNNYTQNINFFASSMNVKIFCST